MEIIILNRGLSVDLNKGGAGSGGAREGAGRPAGGGKVPEGAVRRGEDFPGQQKLFEENKANIKIDMPPEKVKVLNDWVNKKYGEKTEFAVKKTGEIYVKNKKGRMVSVWENVNEPYFREKMLGEKVSKEEKQEWKWKQYLKSNAEAEEE